MYLVTSHTTRQVAVKYRWNVGSLSIYMSTNNQTITLGQRIGQHIGRVSVDISTDARPICWSICRPTHLGRHINRLSTDMSVDIIIDQYVDQYIGRESVDMSICRYIGRGVHKIHMIPYFFTPISTTALNTFDTKIKLFISYLFVFKLTNLKVLSIFNVFEVDQSRKNVAQYTGMIESDVDHP